MISVYRITLGIRTGFLSITKKPNKTGIFCNPRNWARGVPARRSSVTATRAPKNQPSSGTREYGFQRFPNRNPPRSEFAPFPLSPAIRGLEPQPCAVRLPEKAMRPYGQDQQDDGVRDQVAKRRGEDHGHEDFGEPQQEAGERGSHDRASAPQDGGHERLPAEHDPHVRVQHGVGDAEEDPRGGGPRRSQRGRRGGHGIK